MARSVLVQCEMQRLPEPPKLGRRVPAKGQLLALLVGLAGLPVFALAGVLEGPARKSVLHVVAVFLVLTLAFRLIGKRELGRLSPLELVTLMLIPEILSNAVQGQGSLLTSIAGLSAILLMVVGTSLLSHRFPTVEQVLEPTPTLLVAEGKLLEQNMNRERITPDELFAEMRKHGIQRLPQVRLAILENSGNVTFIAHGGHDAADESEVGP